MSVHATSCDTRTCVPFSWHLPIGRPDHAVDALDMGSDRVIRIHAPAGVGALDAFHSPSLTSPARQPHDRSAPVGPRDKTAHRFSLPRARILTSAPDAINTSDQGSCHNEPTFFSSIGHTSRRSPEPRLSSRSHHRLLQLCFRFLASSTRSLSTSETALRRRTRPLRLTD